MYESSDIESNDSDGGDSVTSKTSEHADYLLVELRKLHSPLPLAMLCRTVIRDIIITIHGKSSVKWQISCLPLPAKVRDFLALLNVPTDRVIR